MTTPADKTQENKSTPAATHLPKQPSQSEAAFPLVDHRPAAIAQRKLQQIANNSLQAKRSVQLQQIANNSPQAKRSVQLQEMANNSPQAKRTAQLQEIAQNHAAQRHQPIQKKENKTGLPDHLKSGVEHLSEMSMDDVKVHYHSDKPAQLKAHAYAQGTDIHLASGQEKHLPHEAWHVVQQKQGRVNPTLQMKGGVNVNDDTSLEKEADVMGAKALSNTAQLQSEFKLLESHLHVNNIVNPLPTVLQFIISLLTKPIL